MHDPQRKIHKGTHHVLLCPPTPGKAYWVTNDSIIDPAVAFHERNTTQFLVTIQGMELHSSIAVAFCDSDARSFHCKI